MVSDTYEKARRKAARAELTSHLETDDQDDIRLHKRRARETTVTFNDTSSKEGPSFPSPNFCMAPGSGTQRIEHTKLDDFNYPERVEVSEDELSFEPLNADSIDSPIDEPFHFNALPEARAATTTTTDALSLGLTGMAHTWSVYFIRFCPTWPMHGPWTVSSSSLVNVWPDGQNCQWARVHEKKGPNIRHTTWQTGI
ncbi:unnamed protein product [Orchesella dallaii]|uniref:Uncharacterized protein n=1 Tax=Orchesella dallaii TaxID=48710 RepID=A0ABP1S1K0_9HEXA